MTWQLKLSTSQMIRTLVCTGNTRRPNWIWLWSSLFVVTAAGRHSERLTPSWGVIAHLNWATAILPSDGWTVFAETNWISGRRRLCCRHLLTYLLRDSTSTVCDVIKGTTQISDGKDDFFFFNCHSLTDKQNVCILNKTAHLNRLKVEKKLLIPRVGCLFRPICPSASSSPTPTSLKSSFKSSERNG